MTLELGLSIGMPIITAIFIYLSVNENETYIKMVYQMLGFGFMIASFDIFRKLADAGSMPAGVISMFETLTTIMITIFVAMIFIYFLLVLKDALMMFIPKKKKFSETRDR